MLPADLYIHFVFLSEGKCRLGYAGAEILGSADTKDQPI